MIGRQHPFMRRLAGRCSIGLLLVSVSATVLAQDRPADQEDHLPATGVVTKASPIFRDRDDLRRPIILVPSGTKVQVLRKEGPWYEIAFTDDRLGEQTAYISPFDVKLETDDSAQAEGLKTSGTVSQRGFIEGRAFGFFQKAPNDATLGISDMLMREEVFAKPKRWLQLAAGLGLRNNSHGQVEDDWHLDYDDRSVLRPHIATQRLSASVTTSHFTLDAGKQFIRWGRADILSPTDRFAPRDYLNVLDSEFLSVWGVRTSIQAAGETFEGVWVPRMTPSRLPLLTQRWSVIPPEANGFVLQDNGSIFPRRGEAGARWSHTGRFEMGLSFFDGFNHLPDISPEVDPVRGILALTRTYPKLRTYGGEFAVPTRWLAAKGEAAYFTSPTGDEYVLYVLEAERQVGEWLFDGGYTGEVVTKDRHELSFAAERGLARSIIGRVSYTVDPRRTVAIEAAARQNGHGFYAKGEYSQAFRQHWRLTLAGVGIGGKADDFLGQYDHNAHVSATLRWSF